MNLGYAIGAVRSDNRQVRHSDEPGRDLLDEADAGDSLFFVRKADTNGVEQAAVDFENDFQMSRQQHLEPFDWPFLQGFGQKRVVRVGKGPTRYVPRLIPAQARFVE